ncbi:MAG TPA: hypothetical protein DCF33_00555 [Saprospirales bacterium]|nr:hypothetical protein [Saprospirales bacterium]
MTFDWLSDLRPLFDAQESWHDGSYGKPVAIHLLGDSSSPFTISCGADLLAEHVRRFRFSPQIIQRLGQVTDEKGRSMFSESFLNHLQRIRLRAHVNAAPEGTLLLPGEPILSIVAPELQVRLLQSAIRLLIWDSSQTATQAALTHWQSGKVSEEDTPHPPRFTFNPQGWRARAQYIGGGNWTVEEAVETREWPGLSCVESNTGMALTQIRRLFKGEHPLGDVWLTSAQDSEASVSHTHVAFQNELTQKPMEIQMTRFQNLLQPVLVKGHPALNAPSLDYLRQRTWKQLEAFHTYKLQEYPRGWFISS